MGINPFVCISFVVINLVITSGLKASHDLDSALNKAAHESRVRENKLYIDNLVVQEGVQGCTGCIYYAGMGTCKEKDSIKPCTRVRLTHKIDCVILEEKYDG